MRLDMRVTVHDIARQLPDTAALRAHCQSLAMLEAILSPEWEDRYHSFASDWSETEEMASMSNGAGDEYSIVFSPAGAYIRGFAHESAMSPYVKDGPWPGVIDEVPEDEEVPVQDDFTWLTLGQLRHQLLLGNRVNMNARTVISGIAYGAADGDGWPYAEQPDGFHAELLKSHRTPRSAADLSGALTWLFDQKAKFSLDVRRTSLRDMDEWICDDHSIRHRDGRIFDIIGMSVQATSREVGTWWQPMLEPRPGNVVALICQRRAGVLQFLVQAMVQPGLTDRLELAPTVQFSPGYHRGPQDFPPLTEYLDAPESWTRLDAIQSEDGGRFSKADTRHLVVELPEDHKIEAPDNYRWMTLSLLSRLIHFGYHVNVEARSLAACLL